MSNKRILFGRILLLFGVVAGTVSFWFTLQFTWTPEFAATELPEGPTHSNYHAFREALLALGVNLLLVWSAIQGAKIKFESWAIVIFMAVLYYTGWWLAWPIWGFHAPSVGAETNHLIGTVGGMLGLLAIKPKRET